LSRPIVTVSSHESRRLDFDELEMGDARKIFGIEGSEWEFVGDCSCGYDSIWNADVVFCSNFASKLRYYDCCMKLGNVAENIVNNFFVFH